MGDRRKAFYQSIPNFWSDLYKEEYALYDVLEITKEESHFLRECANRVGRIFWKVADLLRVADEETLSLLGFPVDCHEFIRLQPLPVESVISRFDFVKVNGTFKVMEYNSDTPTFIKETFHVNGKVCDEFGIEDLNVGEEKRLQSHITKIIDYVTRNKPNAYVVFTSHEQHEEDYWTVHYLKDLYDGDATYVPLHDLHIQRGVGLFDKEGRKIDVLYRQTFPIEQMLLDRGENGEEIGLYLMELVQSGLLQLINPPSAFLLQSKGVMSVIWNLHAGNHPFFTEEEHGWIETYFLPTYLEETYFLKHELPYVRKPMFGREGDTVEIFTPQGKKELESDEKTYNHVPAVFQEYVELPKATFQSEKGEQVGSYMYGVFLINGEGSSIGCRIGKKITDNYSYFLPMSLKKE